MTPLTCHSHFRGSQDLSKHFGRISTLSNVSALPSTLGALRTSEALQQLQRAVATASERGKQQQALEVAWNDDFGRWFFGFMDPNEPKNQKDSQEFFRIVYGESKWRWFFLIGHGIFLSVGFGRCFEDCILILSEVYRLHFFPHLITTYLEIKYPSVQHCSRQFSLNVRIAGIQAVIIIFHNQRFFLTSTISERDSFSNSIFFWKGHFDHQLSQQESPQKAHPNHHFGGTMDPINASGTAQVLRRQGAAVARLDPKSLEDEEDFEAISFELEDPWWWMGRDDDGNRDGRKGSYIDEFFWCGRHSFWSFLVELIGHRESEMNIQTWCNHNNSISSVLKAQVSKCK